ncbi:hypothetical protein GCM10011386_14850 [Parapedobacter defluvii]|uniref:Uncharacterized protein n=1 Tax=Parapedobacter defluvii TaxID=2045106 RepID=A0ABQ1LG81_9SPHI|nr:hypothetical protein [Parapedobacter defluvii]GGC23900.1 hypothetical protein GCM10011386_14850 [Parapedobacter defluvii]
MAKSKVSNSEILTYLQERKKSLKKELAEVEKVLSSIDVEEKPSDKKGKKKNKKKLEKAVKAIRKKVAEAIDGVKSVSKSAAIDAAEVVPVPDTKKIRKPRVASKPASASAVTTVPAVVEEEKKSHAPAFDPTSTMDEKIRYALGQKRNSTKEELIEYLNGLEPDYGLSKLRKVVAFRLNHLLKTGKIKGKESKAGIRYS